MMEAQHGGHLFRQNAAQLVGFEREFLHGNNWPSISNGGFVLKAFGERKPAERNGISSGGVLLCIAQNQLAELEHGLVWPPEVRPRPSVVNEEHLDVQDVCVRLVADVSSDVLLGLRLPFISAEVEDL